jgi:hypothetical protein
LGVLSFEIAIAVARFLIGKPPEYDFILLIFVTAAAVVLFLVEGILSARFETKKAASSAPSSP